MSFISGAFVMCAYGRIVYVLHNDQAPLFFENCRGDSSVNLSEAFGTSRQEAVRLPGIACKSENALSWLNLTFYAQRRNLAQSENMITNHLFSHCALLTTLSQA